MLHRPSLNKHSGYPHRFTEVSTKVHVAMWSDAKHLTQPYGMYVALLVSLYGTGLYERFLGWQKSPESRQIVQEFLEREYAFQEELTANLRNDSYYAPYTTPENIWRNRQLVAIWDALIHLCARTRYIIA